MRTIALLASLLMLAGCYQDPEATGAVNACAIGLYPSFNSKNLAQCVAVCIKCEHGTTTTCSTSCQLRGAR